MLLSEHVLILSSLVPSFGIDYQPEEMIDIKLLIFVLVDEEDGGIHHSDCVFTLNIH